MKKFVLAGLLGFFVLQFFSGLFIIYQSEIFQIKQQLHTISTRIHEDVTYVNGKWDTVYYNSDPQLPGTYPVYILTADGFVLERWKPIHGYLDVSDFKHLLSYQTPQTIVTVSNQKWRIYSVPLENEGKIIGVISLSYFNPQEDTLDRIDSKLVDNANRIRAKLHIKDNIIDTSNLDIRQIDYDVAFQVVDQFNSIVSKNNNNNSIDRIPNFIDVSYVNAAIHGTSENVIADQVTGEKFLLLSSVIQDKNANPLGVIVVGRSLSGLYSLLWQFFSLEGSVGVIGVGIFGYIELALIGNVHKTTVNKDPKKIYFNKNGNLVIDDITIAIPYATNQYYLCKALFSSPKKHFETDQLLELFGEEVNGQNARKVYDAMIHINKKILPVLNTRLIVIKNKTYRINPLFLAKIVV